MRHPLATFFLATLLAFSLTPAVRAGEVNLEISTGIFYSELDGGFLGDQAAIGFRGGYRFTDRWALQGSISRVELFDYGQSFVNFDGNATFFDVSGMFYLNPRSRAEVFVYGGIGAASFDLEVGGIFLGAPGTFTTHLGIGLNIRLTKLLYLRPDIRARWLGNFAGGAVDTESSIALGWRF